MIGVNVVLVITGGIIYFFYRKKVKTELEKHESKDQEDAEVVMGKGNKESKLGQIENTATEQDMKQVEMKKIENNNK
jgi:hypothetical protein